jgi:hypothetical protein
VVDYILDKHCPYELKAGVLNYRYHVDACQALEATIANLQERISKHLDHSLHVLDFLEQANILGQLIAHHDEFDEHPRAYTSFFKATAPFKGHITFSGNNTAVDYSMSAAHSFGLPASLCYEPQSGPSGPSAPRHTPNSSHRYSHSTTCRHHHLQCHRCCKTGHIWRDCPYGPNGPQAAKKRYTQFD